MFWCQRDAERAARSIDEVRSMKHRRDDIQSVMNGAHKGVVWTFACSRKIETQSEEEGLAGLTGQLATHHLSKVIPEQNRRA